MEEMSRIVPMRVPRTLIGVNASEQVGTIAKERGHGHKAPTVSGDLIVPLSLTA